MLRVSELYIYPIKSLGGIKLEKALVTDRGFEYDRRWMLIDDNNKFISQREHSVMALLKTHITHDFITVIHKGDNRSIDIPLTPLKQDVVSVEIWDDVCTAQLVSDEADEWFSNILGLNARLVYMPDDTRRFTNPKYTQAGKITSFSDAYPFLLIGQSSLDDLNNRLSTSLPINRFRPNIVFTGGEPYLEDTIDGFVIGDIPFNGVKLCARCIVITIDQNNATSAKEPTKTLASYRRKNNNIYFGQNIVHSATGSIAVGDELIVLSRHHEDRFIIETK
jgi:uncharacterized protein YcbX